MEPYVKTIAFSLFVSLAAFCLAQNLVENGGFDTSAKWGAAGPVWSFDSAVKHSGATSLKYKNEDPNLYILATQQLGAAPGTAYRVSAWIKTEGVEGPDSGGATLALEWKDAEGHFLGGFYPKGLTGTRDWQMLNQTSPRSPSNVATVTVVCYVRKGSVGTAWFDDVCVEPVRQKGWSVTMLEPAFRGRLDGCKAVKAVVRLPDDTLREGSWLDLTLDGPGGAAKRTYKGLAEKQETELPVGDRPAGSYTFTVEWLGADGASLGKHQEKLRMGDKLSQVSRLDGSTLLVRGRPFFPLGAYDSYGWVESETPARLKDIADAGFNCVIPYGILSGSLQDVRSYLDAADKLGLKVIVSVKDLYRHARLLPKSFEGQTDPAAMLTAVVKGVRTHPALLGWYVNDESGPEHYEALKANYDLILSLDPDHACYAVINQPESAYEYVGTADVIGVDPYPVPGAPLTLVTDWMRGAKETGRPIWTVTQIFNKSDYQPGTSLRDPTLREMRTMAFLAIANGASGLMMYSYHNVKSHDSFGKRWAEVKKVCDEVRALEPALLRGKPVELAGSGGCRKAWEADGRLYVLLVNPSDAAVKCTVTLPARYSEGQPLLNVDGYDLSGSQFKVTLPGTDVAVYVFAGSQS
jgi:hypothetical protein